MSKTDLILEALFTGADEAEIARREAEAPKIMAQEWIDEFLERDDIKKNPDGSYDVNGNVELVGLVVTKIPVKFNHVSGNFVCTYNNFTSLEGAPKTVGGDFWCHDTYLTSLEGAPKTVGGSFTCYNNKKTFTLADVYDATESVKGIIFYV